MSVEIGVTKTPDGKLRALESARCVATRRRKERLMFRVERGALVPADTYTQARLREKGYRIGDLLAAELTKPRSPEFWRLAHRIGMLCVRNIEDFADMDAHQALKKIQFDGNIECDVSETVIPGVGVMVHRKPRSLSFESMDQGEFYLVARAMCRHIADRYWPDMNEDQVSEMAESFVEEA